MTAASDLHVRELGAGHRPAWAALVARSPQGTLFHTVEWLTATGVPYELLGCFRGDELRAGIAVGITAPGVAGHPEPALTPYLGWLLPPAEGRRVTTLSANKEMTAAIASALQGRFSAITLRCPPEILDLQPFQWCGFQAGVRYTYRLPLLDLDEVLAGMDSTRRRNLNAATREGLVVESGAPIDAVLALSARSLQRQGQAPAHHAAARRLASAMAALGRCRAFVVHDRSSRPVGGVWIVWDERRAYYLIGGYDDAADTANATALAMWSAIQFTARELGLGEFDFEGSMLPPVERFFRKFGGALLPTYTVSWQARPSLAGRVARRARRLISSD